MRTMTDLEFQVEQLKERVKGWDGCTCGAWTKNHVKANETGADFIGQPWSVEHEFGCPWHETQGAK